MYGSFLYLEHIGFEVTHLENSKGMGPSKPTFCFEGYLWSNCLVTGQCFDQIPIVYQVLGALIGTPLKRRQTEKAITQN